MLPEHLGKHAGLPHLVRPQGSKLAQARRNALDKHVLGCPGLLPLLRMRGLPALCHPRQQLRAVLERRGAAVQGCNAQRAQALPR
jgi:hypothetical protein